MAILEQNKTNPDVGKQRILSVDIAEIGKRLLEELFASYYDKETGKNIEAPFNSYDEITLTEKEYKYVKGKIETTLGQLFLNRYVLEKTNIIQFTGYYNEMLNKKGINKLDTLVNNLVINQKITTKMNGDYIDSRDKIGFWAVSFLSTNVTSALIDPMPNVNKRKSELFEELKDDLNSSDPTKQILAANKVEKELMTMVRENLKSDPGLELYDAGAGNLDNNYKTINVMRGAVLNNATNRYDIVSNSLMNGIGKKDIPAFANSVVAGAYPSAVGTAEAGYLAKQILAVLQSEHIDSDPKSDCGTQKTIPFTITKNNKQYALFRNINVNGKIVQTNLDNIDSFVGKTVHMYSPQCCLHDAICGKCAGMVFHNLGVTNVGLLVTQITQKLLNIKLKSKHDLSQSAKIMSINDIFIDKNNYCYTDGAILKNKVTMKLFIPRITDNESDDEQNLVGFEREATILKCFGIFPVKFYDNKDNLLLSTLLTIPSVVSFNLFSDVQEDIDNYIVTYEPESSITNLAIRQNVSDVEFYLNQIYLYSRTPQLNYSLMTEMMFKCLENNNIDLTGPSITYELLARRVCRYGNDTFAKVYGQNKQVDEMSYEKYNFRKLVQTAGVLQGLLFQSVGESLKIGLSQTLNGIKPVDTPLEKIIRA